MTRKEALRRVKGYLTNLLPIDDYNEVEEIMLALEQESCDDAISRQAAKLKVARVTWEDGDSRNDFHDKCVDCLNDVPPVTPQPKTWYISIDGVMSVFNDFMCEEVDEDGTNIFLKMLKDKAESEE